MESDLQEITLLKFIFFFSVSVGDGSHWTCHYEVSLFKTLTVSRLLMGAVPMKPSSNLEMG